MKYFYLLFLLFFISFNNVSAQEDLLSYLEEADTTSSNPYVSATFKGTRLINGHSVELQSKNVLNFIISHRFGRINGGPYEFFGLDEANVRFGLDYGLLDNLNIGIGRNSFEKTYDGFIKFKFLKQTADNNKIPVSAVLFSSAAINTLRTLHQELPFSSRLAYTWQLLIARKFNSNLSLQIAPTVIHKNLVTKESQPNDLYAVGIGGRYKISKRLAINTEYFYRINPIDQPFNYNALSIGLDIETGGHVFQLHFSNSRSMIEKGFIAETTGNFFNGDIHFGFNISRVFQL